MWRSLGFSEMAVFTAQQIRCELFHGERPYTLLSRFARYPLLCRPHTSDRDVFWQIFIERGYSCVDDIPDVDLVIDCGAYVGYSSAYFLTRFPECMVIAVEPDPSNFRLLETNLAPYKDRVKLIPSGVWSHPVGLKLSDLKYRDGREWATRVRECGPDEAPDMQATDIDTLFKESGRDKISILKMDVEGAEAIVFAHNYESWLPHVENIVIELHDDSFFGQASDIFFHAISNRSFAISRYGELAVCKAGVSPSVLFGETPLKSPGEDRIKDC